VGKLIASSFKWLKTQSDELGKRVLLPFQLVRSFLEKHDVEYDEHYLWD
jgi:hypothetical protein